MFASYVFWLIFSKVASAELIGTYSAVVSLSTIFVGFITIGVPSGVQRFLGKSFTEHKLEDSRVTIRSSILLVSMGVIVCIGVIISARDWMYDVFRIEHNLLILLVLLVASSSIYVLFRAIIIASLKTRRLTKITVISAPAKFSIAIILILFGYVSLSIFISTATFPILISILLAFNILELLKQPGGKKELNVKPETSFSKSIRLILVASIAGWIPNLISIIGSQLGVIVVNGSQGANQAGLYFIAFSIVAALLGIMSVLSAITYPALSAMYDGRKRLAWRMLKLTLIIILPASSSIMFYSKDIMQIFGQHYVEGYSSLEILVISVLPTSVAGFITVLVYSYGNYKQVMAIGLALTIPRVASYFILVPFYGGVGAAIGFVLGSIGGFVASIIVARKIKMQLFWRDLALLFVIPTASAIVLSYIGVNYLLGTIITIFVSYLLYLRLRILDRNDLLDAFAILPPKIRNLRFISLVSVLAKKISPSS